MCETGPNFSAKGAECHRPWRSRLTQETAYMTTMSVPAVSGAQHLDLPLTCATDVWRKAIERGCVRAECPWFEVLPRVHYGRADAVDRDPGTLCGGRPVHG
jgi:hypothetical protein